MHVRTIHIFSGMRTELSFHVICVYTACACISKAKLVLTSNNYALLFFFSPFREAMMQSKVNGQTDCHLGPNRSSAQGTTLSPSRHSNVKKVTGVGGTTYEISVWKGWGPGRQTLREEAAFSWPPHPMTTTTVLHREGSLLPLIFFLFDIDQSGTHSMSYLGIIGGPLSGPSPWSLCLYWRSAPW